MHRSRKNFFIILVSLLALRVIIGLHFFSEGTTKIRDGGFSCAGFLGAAKGPFADSFAKLLDDADGTQRLCLCPKESELLARDEYGNLLDVDLVVDPSPVCEYWKKYAASAGAHFQFDANQKKQAAIILRQSCDYLTNYLGSNEQEILAWVAGRKRLSGFARDGSAKEQTARRVDSIGAQVDKIKIKRKQDAYGWLVEVELTWDEFESRINSVGGATAPEDIFKLERPFKQTGSPQSVIDACLPWFDTIVGVLLVLGLFTRFASLLAICLLGGVVMTQPFWVPGVQNTYYQWVEIGGLLVLFATAAGQFGGLDYFLTRQKTEAQQDA